MKTIRGFCRKNFQFLEVKFSIYLHRCCHNAGLRWMDEMGEWINALNHWKFVYIWGKKISMVLKTC